jgi:hypothetical protein
MMCPQVLLTQRLEQVYHKEKLIVLKKSQRAITPSKIAGQTPMGLGEVVFKKKKQL